MRTRNGILLLWPAISLFAQAPSFDVASVKPSAAGTRTRILIEPNGRFFADGVSLKFLIAGAWRLQPYQISGGENWTAGDTWTIEATAEGVSVPAWEPPFLPATIATRVRSLVNERFSLQSHHETRELPVYRLSIGRNGPKFKVTPSPGGRPEDITPPPGRAMAGPGAVVATAIPMQQVVTLLGRWMDRPIIDKTELTGYVDIRLRFAPETAPRPLPAQPSPDSAAPAPSEDPSIFTAIEEQLGLKLEPAREPIDILVIDSARRPAAN